MTGSTHPGDPTGQRTRDEDLSLTMNHTPKAPADAGASPLVGDGPDTLDATLDASPLPPSARSGSGSSEPRSASTSASSADSLYLDAVFEFEKARDAGRPLSPTAWIECWAARREDLRIRLADYLNKVDLGGRLRAAAQLVLPDFAHYETRELLGKGGMGAVFRVHDARLGRDAAMKIPRPGVAAGTSSTTISERLRQEAQIMSRIDHPNIVAVFEVGELPQNALGTGDAPDATANPNASKVPEGSERLTYYVMRLIEGDLTLQSAVKKARELPDAERVIERQRHLRHVIQVCRAIAFAHSKNVAHRDIKPRNIALGDFGQVYVLDWGLAKDFTRYVARTEVHDSNQSSDLEGTPCYIAPEVAARAAHHIPSADTASPSVDAEPMSLEVERRADIYGLGATLYFVLTGEAPYGLPLMEWLKQVLARDPEPPRHKDRSIARPLEAICLKAMARQPAERYGSANEMADDLERYLADESVMAYREGPGERLARWARKHRTTVRVALFFGLFALLAVSGFRAMRQRQIDLERDKLAVERESRTRHYYHLVTQIAPRAEKLTTGWIDAGLNDIAEAARIETAARDPVVLRTLAARCLAGIELSAEPTANFNIHATGMAFSPDGQQLAISRSYGGLIRHPQIDLLNLKKGAIADTFAIPDLASFFDSTGNSFSDVAISPNGRWMVGAARDGTLYRWDLTTKPPNRESVKLESGKKRLQISSDGRWIVTWGIFPEESVPLSVTILNLETLDVVTKKTQEQLGISQDGTTVAISPDSRYLAFTTGDFVAIREFPQLESQLFRTSFQGPFSFFNQASLVTLRPKELRTLDLIRGGEQTTYESMLGVKCDPASGENPRVALDGELLIKAQESSKRLLGWETSGLKLVMNRPLPSMGFGVESVVHPDGKHLAIKSSYGIESFDIQYSPIHRVVAPADSPIAVFDISPDGRWLATLPERNDGYVSLWSLDDSDLPKLKTRWPSAFQSAHGQPSLSFAPNSSRLVHTAGSRTGELPHLLEIRQFSLPDAIELPKFLLTSDHARNRNWVIHLHALAFGNVGVLYASAHRHLLAWDMAASPPKEVHLPVPELIAFADRIKSGESMVCLAVGQSRVGQCTAGFDGPGGQRVTAVRISDVVQAPNRMDHVALLPTKTGAKCCQFSPDDRVLLVGLEDGTLAIVAAPEPRILAQFPIHDEKVTGIAFLSADLFATGSSDGSIGIWRLIDNRAELQFRLLTSNEVLCLRAVPDKGHLYVAVRGEYRIHRWDLRLLFERFEQLGIGVNTEKSLFKPR